MKRIVIDARESGTSTGRYLDKLVEYIHKTKPAYEVILLAKPHRVSFYQQIAPSFKTIITTHKEFSFAEQLGYWRQIKKLKADLVFFPMVQQPVLYRGKTVTTIQDLTTIRFRNPAKNWLIFTIKREIYKLVNQYVARKANHLLTPTEFVKQDVVSYTGVKPSKVTVTLESADKITEQPEAIASLQNKDFILYVGRPAANKNLNRLVDAFRQLKPAYPDLQLVFAGKLNAEYEKLRAFAGNTPDVIFTDFVSEAELRWLYEHARTYVFPSLSEGFGLPGLEAMQYNLPVVSSNATCLPEVYKDAALYFEPLDSNDMASKIEQILDDKQLAEKLAEKGAALVKTYSWKRMARQTLDVFDAVLHDRAP